MNRKLVKTYLKGVKVLFGEYPYNGQRDRNVFTFLFLP